MQLDIGLGPIQLPERRAYLDHSCVQRVVFPSSLRDLGAPLHVESVNGVQEEPWLHLELPPA